MNRSTFLTAVTLSVGFASHSRAEPPAPVKTPNTVGVSNDEFDQTIAALRQELESVRAARQQARPVLDATQTADDVQSSVQQRRNLLDVLQRLAAARPKTSSKTDRVPPPLPTTETPTKLPEAPPSPTEPLPPSPLAVDAFALGRAAFQLGDYAQAERQFRSAVGSGANKWHAKFLLASSLRLQKKFPEAVEIYDQIIRQSGDSTLQESARWQVANIRWQQALDGQLQRLRECP